MTAADSGGPDACARPDLLPLETAWSIVRDAAERLREARVSAPAEVALWEARGLVLARDVLADRDQPAFHRSAMDGYAVRAADVAGAEAALRVAGEVPAGRSWDGVLGPGEAVAIMTGAPLPEGADAVQMVERTSESGGVVTVAGPLRAWEHVSRRGEDVAAGSVVAEAGRVVDGLTIGVLASVGCARVPVLRRPRVTVISTGDELVPLSDVPGPSGIRDSNRPTLLGMVESASATPVDGGHVRDDPAELRREVRAALGSDVLVLSGGVSAGRYDLVLEALREEGVEVLFHGVAIKPGKPVLFGRHGGGLVFGLPGNPVSTYVTSLLLLLPALAVLRGRGRPEPWTLSARLDGSLPPTGPRTTFHPGVLHQDGRTFVVRAVSWNGSGDQVGFARGNCLVRRDAGSPAIPGGETVTVVLPAPPA